jgi:hypothetical protein
MAAFGPVSLRGRVVELGGSLDVRSSPLGTELPDTDAIGMNSPGPPISIVLADDHPVVLQRETRTRR